MKLKLDIDDEVASLIDTGGKELIDYLQAHLREWVFCKTHFESVKIAKAEGGKDKPDHDVISKCVRVREKLGLDHRRMDCVKVEREP